MAQAVRGQAWVHSFWGQTGPRFSGIVHCRAMVSPSLPALSVELTPLPPSSELQREWRALESRAQPSFFLTWSWIGPWLACLPADIVPQLLRARSGDATVGLGLLVPGRIQSLPLMPGRALWLHATGQPQLDGIAIEHNGLLVDESCASCVSSAMLEHLVATLQGPPQPWRRVHLPHLHRVAATQAQVVRRGHAALRSHDDYSWIVDLRLARAHPQGYLGVLDAKSRWTIRRTLKACAAIGPITVTQAQSVAQAQAFLSELLQLHVLRWREKPGGSAFATPFAQRFHATLIADAFERGEIQLLRVCAGSRPLGYLYNFVHAGRISHYQSGFDYSLLDARMSPGLATLALGIEHNAGLGHAQFDFLSGASHYKRALSTHGDPLSTVIFDRPGLRHGVESWLRALLLPRLRQLRQAALGWKQWWRARLRLALWALLLPAAALALDACSDALVGPADDSGAPPVPALTR